MAGAASRDITPAPGFKMAGFAVRTEPALGAHDPLTVRALCIDDTALLVADVIGVDAETSKAIRARCCLPDDNVVVSATHTHGGPGSMRGRLGNLCDEGYLRHFENACVDALDAAYAARRRAGLEFGYGADPGIARNRRHSNGPVDGTLPILKVRAEDGAWIAVVTSYACHPVVLSGLNRYWTADYPHFVRQAVEVRHPGALCLFLTGCAGDANTGHSAQSSISLAPSPERSFEEAGRIGRHIGAMVNDAITSAGRHTDAAAVSKTVFLAMERCEREASDAMVNRFEALRGRADPAEKAKLDIWISWARTIAGGPLTPLPARVTVLAWGDVRIVTLPGEIFADTAQQLRNLVGGKLFVLGYADDNPGYIPPVGEFAHGGYEIDEAHRFYGLPAGFAPGSAEILRDAALECLDEWVSITNGD